MFIHDVDIWTHGSREAFEQRYKEAAEGAFKALAELRSQGVIRAIGMGVNETEPCVRLATDCDPDVFLLAGRYTLLEQGGLGDLIPMAQKEKFSFLLGGPYNSGILATGAVPGAKYNYKEAPPEIMERVRRIEAVCQRHGVPLKAAAIQFPLGLPEVAAIVPGAVRPEEVEDNLRMITHKIRRACGTSSRTRGCSRASARCRRREGRGGGRTGRRPAPYMPCLVLSAVPVTAFPAADMSSPAPAMVLQAESAGASPSTPRRARA